MDPLITINIFILVSSLLFIGIFTVIYNKKKEKVFKKMNLYTIFLYLVFIYIIISRILVIKSRLLYLYP